MKLSWILPLLTSLLCFLGPPARCYVPTLTAEGTPVRWKSPVKLKIVGNTTNQSGLSPESLLRNITRSLERVKSASHGVIHYDYWQGQSTDNYPTNSDFNGVSSLYFLSAAGPKEPPLSPNVLGVTQVWYNSTSGEILETDILLNDRNFQFTENPQDTSGSGGVPTVKTKEGKVNVFIQNVITHESLHSIGFAHSGGIQSTMLFLESPEQAYLGCDEHVGMRAFYPPSDGPAEPVGSLSGKIISERNAPLFGAHVVAISQRRGTVLATGLSDPNGDYKIEGLEPGIYFILAEPFFAGAPALPSYYAAINGAHCTHGGFFARTFLTERDGFHLSEIEVKENEQTLAPILITRCTASGRSPLAEAPFLTGKNQDTPARLNQFGMSRLGILDQLNPDESRTYFLKAISDKLRIQSLSFSLYSPVHLSLSLYDSLGNPVSVTRLDPLYVGQSGYQNKDSLLIAENLPTGDYFLQVSVQRLQPSEYPGGGISLDTTPFFALIGGINEAPLPLNSSLALNARCLQPDSDLNYQSPTQLPPQSKDVDQSSGTGFCGQVKVGKSVHLPPQAAAAASVERIGWFIPWILMLGLAQLEKYWFRSKRLLLHTRAEIAILKE